MLAPMLTNAQTLSLLRSREEWRIKKDQLFLLRQQACHDEDDDNLNWFTGEYEKALHQYRAACDALDLRN